MLLHHTKLPLEIKKINKKSQGETDIPLVIPFELVLILLRGLLLIKKKDFLFSFKIYKVYIKCNNGGLLSQLVEQMNYEH